jgi:hypothetical protein
MNMLKLNILHTGDRSVILYYGTEQKRLIFVFTYVKKKQDVSLITSKHFIIISFMFNHQILYRYLQ